LFRKRNWTNAERLATTVGSSPISRPSPELAECLAEIQYVDIDDEFAASLLPSGRPARLGLNGVGVGKAGFQHVPGGWPPGSARPEWR